MIKIENTEVFGWEAAIRGMRNPKNSWERSDSGFSCSTCFCNDCVNNDKNPCGQQALYIGSNDHDLMMKLAKGGSVHAKYRRMITVYCDIIAPLYWWKEFDTYKIGTVANSCSTMHKIHEKEFTIDDFSCEHLMPESIDILKEVINELNKSRKSYIAVKADTISDYDYTTKDYWWQMIQLLPSSYNQKRTVMLNYEVLANIFEYRKRHKLDEWVEFCKWIETLPYSEIITKKEELK